ncbi:aminoglycoside phosphotransferase family protein [Saccharothrix hoggarensis]|uniref:Aminoglycoside phosphotransferase family protein n=1 Tax=Saccharothrix hoggarensis TaxID=913853 RepID=A0ABW3R4X8_9PSEU
MPPEFARWRAQVEGEAGREWVAGLPDLVDRLCARWRLTPDDTPPLHGGLGLVVLVHRGDVPCALKVSQLEDATVDEALALTTWDGRGAVRLHEADPEVGALLLERLDPAKSLHDLDLRSAAEVAGGLIRRLAVPAPAGVRPLAGIADVMVEHLPRRQRALGDPVPRRWVDAARGFAAELGAVDHDVLVHADLHYGNVLAGDREPWLAVDARAVRGRPEFSVPELMWTRADDGALDSDTAVRRLLAVIVAAGELDADAAHGWVVARCVDYWLWGLENGLTIDPARCRKVLSALLS